MMRSAGLGLVAMAVVAGCGGKQATRAPGNAPGGGAEAAPVWRSFWDTHSEHSGSRQCDEADLATMKAHDGEPAAARAEAWGAVVKTCWLDWQGGDGAVDPAGLAAYTAFATALLEAGFPHDCESMLTPLTTPYPGGLQSMEGEDGLPPEAEAVIALGERCAVAADAELAGFKPPTCPSDDACFALVDPADEDDDASGDPDAEMMDDFTCPVVEQRTAAGTKTLTADDGQLADNGFCCGIDSITTAVVGGQRYVLVRPSGENSMFIRVCGGGTASATPVSVYRVEGDRLVLAADRTLSWH